MTENKTPEDDSLHSRIERVLSEILSDKYDCKVTMHFVQKDQKRSEKEWTSA